MNDNLRYPNFSRKNGPDLGALVAAFGGYDKITPEAWRRFSTQTRWWRTWVRRGGLHNDPNAFVSPQEIDGPEKGPLSCWPAGYHWYTRKRWLQQRGWKDD